MGVSRIKGRWILVILVGCGLIASWPMARPLNTWGAAEAGSEQLTVEVAIGNNMGSSSVGGSINEAGAMTMDVTSPSLAPLACDPTAVFIRPASYTNPDPGTGSGFDSVDAGLTNPDRAIDNDHTRATQSSAQSREYRCFTDCGGAKITYGCRWFNFPAGYTPRELRVKWFAQGPISLQSGQATVQAKIS